jgi:hypothetical protein
VEKRFITAFGMQYIASTCNRMKQPLTSIEEEIKPEI